MSADKAAEDILKAVLANEKDVILAPFYIKVMTKVRVLFPSLYFWIMQMRADKSN